MILCCGEALIDMIPTAHGGFQPCPGGSPYNTAIAIARLNVPAAFLGRLSTDFFGEILIQRLRHNRVREDFIIRSGEHSTLAFVKLEAGAEPQYVFYTEGSADRSLSPADIPPALPPEVRGLLFGSIAMTLEPAASSIESLIRREAARGGEGPLISFDPNVRPFMIPCRDAYVKRFEGWASLAAMVKVSAQDYDFIYPGLGLEAAMRRALSLGPCLAVSTLGSQGALALLKRPGGGFLRVRSPAEDLPVADTIGAGDTFHGALLAWLERRGMMSRSALAALGEGELADALGFANRAASLVCSKKGAEPPSLAEVENR